MRKTVLTLVAAGTALAFAAPATAQYYGAPRYNHSNYGYGQVRSLQVRIDNIQRQIRQLDRRNVIRDDPADRLRAEANRIEDRLHRSGRNGLNPREADEINARIARLEERVQATVAYGRRDYRRY